MSKEKQRIHQNYELALQVLKSGGSISMPKSKFSGGFNRKKKAA